MGRAAVAIELTALERQELEFLARARARRARGLRGEPVLSLPQPLGMRTR